MTDVKSLATGGKVWNPYVVSKSSSDSITSYSSTRGVNAVAWFVIGGGILVGIMFAYLSFVKENLLAVGVVSTTNTTLVSESVDKTWAILYCIIMMLAFLCALIVFWVMIQDGSLLTIMYAFVFFLLGIQLMLIVPAVLKSIDLNTKSNQWSEEMFGIPIPQGINFLNTLSASSATGTNKDGDTYLFNLTSEGKIITLTADLITAKE